MQHWIADVYVLKVPTSTRAITTFRFRIILWTVVTQNKFKQSELHKFPSGFDSKTFMIKIEIIVSQ